MTAGAIIRAARFFTFLVVMFLPHVAHAQDRLAFESLIREHFDAIVALYTVEKIDHEAIAAFTEDYVDESAIFKVQIKANHFNDIKEYTHDKSDFLASLNDNTKDLYNAGYKYTIVRIDLSEDGFEADVRFTALLEGTGRMVQDLTGKTVNIGLRSFSDCIEKFRHIEAENKIVGLGSDCRIEAIYQKPVPVE